MVVKTIYGMMTVRFKNGLVRSLPLELGYANAKVRRAAGAFAYLGLDVSDR